MPFNSGYRGRRANDGQGMIGQETQFLQNISPRPYISGYTLQGSDDTALDPAGGQTVIINGSGFATGVSAVVGGVQIGSVTLISSKQISFTTPAKSSGSYTLLVYNPSSDAASILVPGLIYSGVPQWTTAAGSIGSVYETTEIDTSVVATSDSAITYTLSSGSLPDGSTLYANGVITGTAPVDSGSTTYTFAVTATDAELQDTTRTFTLTVNTDVVTWVNPALGAAITLDGSAYSTELNATDAAGYSVSYTANALPTGLTLSGNTISGTPTVVGGTTTLLTATAATTGRTSTNTITWTVSLGDAYWDYVTTLLSASTPSPLPFNDDASTNNFAVTINGDTKPNNFNPYSNGYYSTQFAAKTDYISIPATTALTTFTGDFTFEAWIYPTDTAVSYWKIWDSRQNGATAQAMVVGLEPLASAVAGQGRLNYFNGTSYYGTGIVYYNRWTHIAFVRSGSTMTFYVDGVAGGTATISGTQTGSATTNPVWIGTKDNGLASYGSTGYISNLRVVNGTAVYTGNFTPSTSPLTAITNTVLLACQSNRQLDNSNNNYVLTASSGAKVMPFDPYTSTTSTYNTLYSTYFDGTGDYLTAPSNAAFNITSGSTDSFVCEAWVNWSRVAANMSVIDNGGLNAVSFSNWSITLNASSQITLAWGNSGAPGSTIGTLPTSTVPTVGTWYHIAFVKTSDVWSLYINGTRATTFTGLNTAAKTSSSNLYLGYGIATGAGGAVFAGSISNLRIYKGATASAPYNANSATITVPTTTLTAITNTQLLTCQNATLIDNSTNAFAITSYGQAQPIAISPFTQTTGTNTLTGIGSTYFDGTGDYLSVPYSAAFSTGTTYTIDVWVYPTVLNAANQIFNVLNTTVTNFGGWVTWINGSGTVYFESRPGNGGTNIQMSGGTAPLNTWTHIAVSVSAGTAKLFVNGVQTDIDTVTALDGTQSFVAIGAITNGYTASPFTGYMTDVRLVKGTALYTANFAPPTSPLTAVSGTSLLTCQSNQPVNNNVFLDSSTNALAITRNGNTTQGTFSPYGENWSNYFDGSGDYLTLPVSTNLAMGSGDYTVECWVYLNSVSGLQGVYSSIDNSADAWQGPYMGFSGTSFLATSYVPGNDTITHQTAVTVGQWYHIAMCRSGSATKSYLNGVQSTSTTTSSYSLTQSGSTIGSAYPGTSPLNGYISNLRVVKGTALYTSNFTPSTTPLQAVANTSLLTCQSPIIVDNSPNNFAITKNGDVSVQKFSPFAGTTLPTPYYSGYFDGSGDYLSLSNTTAIGSGSFTMECWVYLTSAPSVNYWIYGYRNGADTSPYFFVTSSRAPVFGGDVTTYLTGSAIALNTWTHVAVVRNGTAMTMYQNGVSTATATSSQTFSYTGTNNIGQANGANAYNYLGNISNFRIVVGTAVYTSAFTPSTTPLTAISGTNLLTCQSNTFIDNSTNNFTITANGNATPRQTSPFTVTYSTQQSYTPAVYGGSMYFGATSAYTTYAPATSDAFGTGDFTVECWVYPTVASVNICMGSSTTSTWQLLTYLNQVYWQENGSNLGGAGYGSIPLNAWTHLAVSRSGTTLRIFVNGVSVYAPTNSYNYSASPATRIVGPNAGGSAPYYLSDFRIIKGTALYTSNFVPQNQPLTPVKNTTLLLNGTGAGIYDSSEIIEYETLGDAKRSTSIVPFSGSTSMYFDGSGDYLATVNPGSNFKFGTSNWTIEAWMYSTSTSTTQTLYMIYGTTIDIIKIYFNGTTLKPSVDIRATNQTSIVTATSTISANLNSWNHVAVVRDSATTVKLYVNGVLGATATIASTSTFVDTQFSQNPTVGAKTNTVSEYFAGYISDLRVTKGIARYTTTFTPPTSPFSIK